MLKKLWSMKGVWLLYLMMAIALFLTWKENDWFPVIGDEPHYLVMADGFVRDFTFEQTNAYKREFRDRAISKPGLAPTDAIPSALNTHCVEGPNGLYNTHNIGLPILLGLPYFLSGTTGVKLFLIVLSSLTILVSWKIVSLFTESNTNRAVVVMAVAFSSPLFLASNQIYPDLVAGIIALYAGYYLLGNSDNVEFGGRVKYFLLIAIAFLPWLQIKFAAPACILSIGIFIATQDKEKTFTAFFKQFLPIFVSLALIGAYNQYAFGQLTGPYDDGALELSLHSLMVFFGLHVDRFQGIFIQAPIYFVGLLFMLPFMKRNWVAGITILLTYASFVVPNALHPNWYGGYSFAGRFAWSGSIVILPFVLYGASKIVKSSKVGFFFIVFLIAINLSNYSSFVFQYFGLYNVVGNKIWLSSYPSFYPMLTDFLPALYDSSLAYALGVNVIFFVFFVGLVFFGAFYKRENEQSFYLLLILFVILGSSLLPIASSVFSPDEPPFYWSASELPSQIGITKESNRIATSEHGQGFLSFGPYLPLRSGKYRFKMKIDIVADTDAAVGLVDIVLVGSPKPLCEYELYGRDNPVLSGEFTIPGSASQNVVEVRTFYHGKGRLKLYFLEISQNKKIAGK